MNASRWKKNVAVMLLIGTLTVISVAACRTQEAATPDVQAIVERAVASTEGRLMAQMPTPASTLDVDGLRDEILGEVEELIQLSIPTPPATPNSDEIAASVLAQIDPQIEDVLVRLYESASPGVVSIEVPPIGSGSGFVYDTDGHIVTNNHVVESGSFFEVVFSTGQRAPARLVGTDVDSDLAVIKVEALPDEVQPLQLAAGGSIRPGQFVIAIGNPFGEQGSMSLGIVSGLGRSLRSQRGDGFSGGYSLPQVIQTDAPINPGNSGGPLLNLGGEVVGVNAAIATRTGTNSGVGFSIPVAAVRKVVPSLIEAGVYKYPYIGAGFDEQITLEEQSFYGLPQTRGAYVVSVTPGSPAEEAGLQPADPQSGQGGDLIIKIDDQEIKDFSDLNSYLVFQASVGQTIRIKALRAGSEIEIPLTLSARP